MKLTLGAMLVGSVVVLATSVQAGTLNIQMSFNAGDFSTQYITETRLPKIEEMTEGVLRAF